MRLLHFLAIWLCICSLATSTEDVEEATVTEELPATATVGVEEVSYVSPTPSGNVYFAEHFDNPEEFEARWVRSQAKKDGADDAIAKYDGKWAIEGLLKDSLKGDNGLVLKSKAKHAAISASLDRPFFFTNKPLIVQYDVTLQNGQECGGAYIKLLTKETGMRLSQFHDKTPYTIMFGPDKCGNDHKLHFIFQHKNPNTGEFSEKHAKKPAVKLDDYFKDGKPHLYTLIIQPDNSFDVSVDYKVINRGSLLEDFTPPVNPPAEIDDPSDSKPDDWDEREKIPDPDAKKPDDWDEDEPEQIPDPDATQPDGWLEDEPEMIPDPTAEKPEDWDEEMDGTWEAPLINNPACESAPGCGTWKSPLIANPKFKGKWRPPMIDNPNYRGKWRPRRIPNPDFFEDKYPFNMAPISAIGIELWSMSDNIMFDNFIITDDIRVAETWAKETFDLKRNIVDKDQDFGLLERFRQPTHWFQSFGRWANRSDWFWPLYGFSAFVPVILFLIYLFWWSRTPDEVKKMPFRDRVSSWFNNTTNVLTLYGVYLAIPLGAFLWYLWNRVVEESLVQRVMSYTNKNPWLWGVYVIVIGLPVVLIFSFCCGSQEKQDQLRAAKAKKTDEAVEDDEAEAANDAEGEAAAAAEDDDQIPPLEGSEDEAVKDQDEEEEEEEEAPEADTVEKTEEPVKEKPSPRRRRTRKE